MGNTTSLRPITDARLEVIPRHRRDRAFALMARSQGKPTLIPVPDRPAALIGDPEKNDFAIGLFAKIGCSTDHILTGIVAVRERFATNFTSISSTAPTERVFLIDALTVSSDMPDWRPAVRTLLAATAATVIATIAHDPGYRTYVACRTPRGDAPAGGAIAAIGGRPLEIPKEAGAPMLAFGTVPTSELSFLDAAAAASAARIVAQHMSGEVQPTFRYLLSGPGERTCEALLLVKFPRSFRHLKPEIESIASGDVDLQWRTPAVVGNDVSFPLTKSIGHG